MKKDLNKIAASLQEKMDSVVDSVKDVKIPDINLKDVKVPIIKIEEIVSKENIEMAKDIGQQLADKVQDGVESVAATVKTKVEEIGISIDNKAEDAGEYIEETGIDCISTKSAIKIFYYMISADGTITDEELEKFNLVGLELDPAFAEHKEEIIAECKPYVDPSADDYYAVLIEGIEEAINTSVKTADTFITPKLLVWDLLTIAYSDETCEGNEKKLIDFVAKKYEFDEATFLEMESSILTYMDIDKEIAWIKTTNRPYLTIEAMVNELESRKNAIIEGIHALILL